MFSASHLAAALLVLSSPDVLAYNLLKNPDFVKHPDDVSGLVGWNTSGAASWESYLSAPADGTGGSLRLDSDPGTAHADQCVDVRKWLDIDVAVTKFNNASSGDGTHTFKLDVYDQAGCTGNILSTITLPETGAAVMGNNGATWTEVSVLGTPLPSGAISAKMNLDTAATSGSISYFLLDHVQVVPPDEIFPDEFEGN